MNKQLQEDSMNKQLQNELDKYKRLYETAISDVNTVRKDLEDIENLKELNINLQTRVKILEEDLLHIRNENEILNEKVFTYEKVFEVLTKSKGE